eukprot:TRINITY_DN781_c0_g1_i1.p1 TRINITY_DN781_c0_g1~~TRINITY_DN781_c0_g1_i1.p1  ORF type:complete len:860 (+),score=139.28 TRINITY_DN781_c0_g1_i1:5957-8536(+)
MLGAVTFLLIKTIGDSYGQLGISSKGIGKSYSKPKQCSFNIVIRDISCGDEHAAFLTNDGLVYTMGNNLNGRLGLGDSKLTHSSVPCLVESFLETHVVNISCGWTHTAAVTDQGTVYTWGLGEFGALGHNDTLSRSRPEQLKFFMSGKPVKQVSCGSRHTAFVVEDGELYACGAGDAGQLGIGSRNTELVPKKVLIEGEIIQVACGIFHTCAITSTGKLFATGGNSFGQLGLGHKKGTTVMTQVKGILEEKKIKAVSCGHHTAALTEEGELFVWGSGVFGEELVPKRIGSEGVKYNELAVGGAFAAVLDEEGKIWVWGSNTSGELGTGDYDPRNTPCMLGKLKGKSAVKIACGGSYAICLGVTHSTNETKSVPPSVHSAHAYSSLEPGKEQMQNLSRNNPPEEGTTTKVDQVIMPSVSEVNTAEIFSSISQRDPHQPLLSVLTKQRDYLEEALDKERKERKRVEDELLKVKADNAKLKNYAEEIESQKQRGESEVDNLINACSGQKARIGELEQKVLELENANLLLENLGKEKDAKIAEFMKTKDTLKKKYAHIKGQVKAHIETENKLEKENYNLIKKLKENGTEVQEFQSKNEALIEQVQSLERQLKETMEQKEKLENKLQEWGIEFAESNATTIQLQEKVEVLERGKTEAEAELIKQKEIAEQYENDLIYLQGEFEELKKEINATNNQAKEELRITKNKLEKVNDDNKVLQNKVQEMANTNEKLAEKVKALELKFDEASGEVTYLKKANADLSQRNAKLMEALHQDLSGSIQKTPGRAIISPGKSSVDENEQFSFREIKPARPLVSPPQNLVVASSDDPTDFDTLRVTSPLYNNEFSSGTAAKCILLSFNIKQTVQK